MLAQQNNPMGFPPTSSQEIIQHSQISSPFHFSFLHNPQPIPIPPHLPVHLQARIDPIIPQPAYPYLQHQPNIENPVNPNSIPTHPLIPYPPANHLISQPQSYEELNNVNGQIMYPRVLNTNVIVEPPMAPIKKADTHDSNLGALGMLNEKLIHHNPSNPVFQCNNILPNDAFQKLEFDSSETWLTIGNLATSLKEYTRAVFCYELALRHNPYSVPAMKSIAMSYHKIENFLKAIEYFQNVLNIDAQDGVSWGYLGYCLVMIDDLPKAFSAYQQAFNNLRNSEDPLLWYGIGIMYERFECLEYSEEAFCQVIKINPNFEKANEIYFRLGIIYKLQREFKQSLGCFQYILHNPPEPLTDTDVWFQIGLIHEQEKDYEKAREAYECVLIKNPDHVKVLQHLGCIFHQSASPFCNQDIAINYLTKSLEADYEDALTWYYLGRCNIAQKDFVKAYESLQQAVHRDNKNAAIWFSIGSMYFQTNRHHDAHDAYSQALKLDPNYPQAWYDLGMIYELSGNQLEHAIDAYKKVVELVQSCDDLKARVYQLIQIQQNGSQGPLPPPLPYKEFSLHLPHSTKKESLINGLPLPPTWYRNDKNQAPQLDVMYGVPPIPPSAPISTEEQSIILQQQCQVILSSEATHPEPKTWQYIKPHNNQLPILINNLPTERPIPILTQLNTTVPNHQIRGETIQSKISTPELITSPYASEPFILDQPYENKLKTERTTDTKIEIVADGKRSHEIDDLRKGSPYYPKKPKRGSKDDILKISPLSPKSNGNTPVETKACSLLAILEPESSKSPNSNFDKDPKKDRPKNMLEV